MSIRCVYMERKEKVLNVRLSPRQRSTYERAAALEGITVSALVTSAADQRAEEVLRSHATLIVASDTFDRLLKALDTPAALATPLEKALTNPVFEQG
jgi:uncharacterized protein (DUF1778 family)